MWREDLLYLGNCSSSYGVHLQHVVYNSTAVPRYEARHCKYTL